MKLPEKIKVGGHEYSVLFPYNFRERTDLAAQCDSALMEIRVSECDECGSKRSDSNIAVSLLHELIHAIDNAHGANALSGGSSEKEAIVESIAQGIYQVMKDNPYLLAIFYRPGLGS